MGLAKYTQKSINPKLNLKTEHIKLGEHMQHMILKMHTNFYGDCALGGAIRLIQVTKNTSMVNYQELAKMLFLNIDLRRYSLPK